MNTTHTAMNTTTHIATNTAVHISAGPYNATIIEVVSVDGAVFDDAWFILCVRDEEKKNQKSAVYVVFPFTEAMTTKLLPIMFGTLKDFVFRATYTRKNDGVLYMEYYKWTNPNTVDMVPAFATSISGVNVLLFDDHNQLLFITETNSVFGGKKKFPGGAADLKESVVDAAMREVEEEVGLSAEALDLGTMHVIFGYSEGNARPGGINDQFLGLSIRVPGRFQDRKFQKPDHEIKDISIITIDEYNDMPSEQRLTEFLDRAILMVDRHLKKQGLPLKPDKANSYQTGLWWVF